MWEKIYKKLPKWAVGALAADIVLFLIMHNNGKAWCGDISTSICYRLVGDRFADYLALIVAIMAILIPVSIELWKKQFVAQNLSPKSPLDTAWSRKDRMAYLCEPVSSMAIFVLITIALPLLVNSSALFYADAAYGMFLLVYVFFVSFFKKPPNVYELEVLNPSGGNLPSRDIISELATTTLEKASETSINFSNAESAWSIQLSEVKTLEKLVGWLQSVLSKHGDLDKISLWPIFVNFITKCNIDVLWLSAYDKEGVVRKLFTEEEFYQPNNLGHAAQILKTITERFINSGNYYLTIGNLLSIIPVDGIPEKDVLTLLEPTFHILFTQQGDNGLVLKDNFPDDWQVSVESVDKKLPKVMTSMYLQWIWHLQMEEPEKIPNEPAVQDITEIIFPDIEPILFAKFVLLRINMVRLESNNINTNAEILEEAIGKWHIFGHIGRTTAMREFIDDDTLEDRWKHDFKQSITATLELVKRLGWFAWGKDENISNMLRWIIKATKWSDPVMNSWTELIDMLGSLFEEKSKERDQ